MRSTFEAISVALLPLSHPTLSSAAAVEIFGSGKLHIWSVPVEMQNWNRIDRHCAWKQFSDAILSSRSELLSAHDCTSSIDRVLAVDWSSLEAIRALLPLLPSFSSSSSSSSSVPIVYLNFRVFHCNSNISDEDRCFYRAMEHQMCISAEDIVALCDRDRHALEALLSETDDHDNAPHRRRFATLHPPLRNHIEQLTWINRPSRFHERGYITCCCRLSPEKNTLLFVEAMIASKELLKQYNLVAFLCGSSSDSSYAEPLKARLMDALPDAIICDFLDAKALVDVFRNTLLNVHPAVYEAYGMTIIEAAAAGAPSLIHHSDIGAGDMLIEVEGVIQTDMSNINKVCESLETLLSDMQHLEAVAERARYKALSWNEQSSGDALFELIQKHNH